METHSSANGLTQLFMRLGLNTQADGQSLLSGADPSGAPGDSGFARLFSQYLSDDSLQNALPEDQESSPLLQAIRQGQADTLPESGRQPVSSELPLQGTGLPQEAQSDLSVHSALSGHPLLSGKPITDEKSAGSLSESLTEETDVSGAETGDGYSATEDDPAARQQLVTDLIRDAQQTSRESIQTAEPVTAAAVAAGTQTVQRTDNGAGRYGAGHGAGTSIKQDNNRATTELTSGDKNTSLTDSVIDTEWTGEETDERFLGAERKPAGESSVAASLQSGPVSLKESVTAPGVQAQVSQAAVTADIAAEAAASDVSVTEYEQDPEIADDQLDAAEKEHNLRTREGVEQDLKLNKGQHAWGEAISERITMAAARDVQQATIHLDPPELGTLELKLQINDDQQTQVQAQVQNPQVREVLESSAHRLRDMLAAEGLELSGFDVQTQDQHGTDDQNSGDSDQQDGSAQNSGDAVAADDTENITEQVQASVGLLNTYA